MLSAEKTVKNYQTVQEMPVQQVTGIAFGYMQAISEAKERWGPEFEDGPAGVQDFVLALETGLLVYMETVEMP